MNSAATSGAVIVGEASYVGERGYGDVTDTSSAMLDQLMKALIDRYFEIDCAIFTLNQQRPHTYTPCEAAIERMGSCIVVHSSVNRIS
jgi:hypothetical protein